MAGDFVYDIKASLTRHSDGDLLGALRAFVAQAKPGQLSTIDFQAWKDRPCGRHVIIERFGSWRMALRLIGVDWRYGHKVSAEELLAELERVWRELGRPPGVKEMNWRGEFRAGPYQRRWGSVRRACELVAMHHAGKISRAQVVSGDLKRGFHGTIPLSLRWRVIKRDGYRCVVCGANPVSDPKVELHVDHITPVSCGGKSEEGNLRTLCAACNMGRGNEKKRGGGRKTGRVERVVVVGAAAPRKKS